MGAGTYNESSRSLRASQQGYDTKSRDDIFEQNRKREIHKDMNPFGINLRESRDSVEHPNSFPIIIVMDVTGSMGVIPHELIKDGLPKIVSGVIAAGLPDPQIMFMAVGDHISDNAPLQISQFESSDEALDMWLTRTWIEGNGGGNGGESYPLAYHFIANTVQADHWQKRGKKGVIITIGDEPSHTHYPGSSIRSILGGEASDIRDQELLDMVKEQWNVFHVFPGKEVHPAREYWEKFLGANALWAESPQSVADTIKSAILQSVSSSPTYRTEWPDPNTKPQSGEPEIL